VTSKTPPQPPRPQRQSASSGKDDLLKAALKANLHRRKAQARKRKSESGVLGPEKT